MKNAADAFWVVLKQRGRRWLSLASLWCSAVLIAFPLLYIRQLRGPITKDDLWLVSCCASAAYLTGALAIMLLLGRIVDLISKDKS